LRNHPLSGSEVLVLTVFSSLPPLPPDGELSSSSFSFSGRLPCASRSSLDTCNDIVQILLPEIVLRELVEQKVIQYEKDVDAYNMLALRMDKLKEEFDSVSSYRDEALKQAKEFLDTKSVNLIPICDKMYWNRIIDKAIRKEAPFEGVEGKADKGFKDTLIFFSMIDYARNNRGSYYFVSKDRILAEKLKGEV